MNKREITKVEKNIANDILSRSNYSQEEANNFAKIIVDFGYTIHEQDFYKLKNAIEILKDTIILPMENDIARVDINGNNHYLLSFIKRLINEQEYELLKEVLDND